MTALHGDSSPSSRRVGPWFTRRVRRVIERAMAGDRDAEWELLEAHRRFIRGLLVRYGARAGDLDDLTQDVISGFVQDGHCRRLEDPKTFRAYLRSYVRGRLMNHGRKASTRRSRQADDEVDDVPAPSTRTADPDQIEPTRRDVVEAMFRIRPQEREAVLLHGAGHTYAEIARMLGVPESTVNNWIRRARRAIRDMLRGEE